MGSPAGPTCLHTSMANKLTLSAVGLFSLLAAGTFAQTATTTPVGFMRYTIAGGSQAAPATTAIAIPLHDVGGVSGVSTGTISAVGTTTITVTSAGWTPNGLSAAAIPYALCIKSGSAGGSILKISANTDTILTLESSDLVAKGVLAGDRFEIIPIDTLSTLFGATTLLPGTGSRDADVVYLMSAGSWVGYYFNTAKNCWKKTSDLLLVGPRDNTIVPPGSGVLIERRGTAFDLVVTGTVPSMQYRIAVANSGNTLLHTGFPTDVTLGNFSLGSLLLNWVASSDVKVADWVYIKNGAGGWVAYYNNGNHWRSTADPIDINRNSILISAGSPILLFKKGMASGTTELARVLPYSL